MDLSLGVSDVRDVAHAHVLALEREEAEGRCLCCGQVVHVKRDIVETVLRPALGAETYFSAAQRELILKRLPSFQMPSWLLRVMATLVLPREQGEFVKAHRGRPPTYDNSESSEKSSEKTPHSAPPARRLWTPA
ncbi:unnamed protein product [Polarella glacialis]|uniref:Uncharacterized protein n=1 Tax=Polarella glacialis TaxID=89957 RepID=A0A813K944_POLGL|nr:unnamed protein product [Polarella glacialis]CAE8695845.1 unnamed protein product [Polarella glacialis]